MRVAHGFPDSRVVSGVNQSVWQLARAQAAAGRYDRVTVLTFDPAARALASDGVDVVVVRLWRLLATLVRLRPDVLHLHSVMSPSLTIATAAARLAGIPVVASPRGGYNPRAVARRNLPKRWYTHLVEGTRVRWSRLLLALTDREAAHIEALYGARPVRVVGNGVDPLLPFANNRTDPGVRPTLVYLGRSDVDNKGIDRMFDLAVAMPEAALHIHGDGFDRLAASGAAPANVRFMGVVSGAAKAEVLAGAACYVQLSRFEAFGRSLVEAMGVGTPVAVSADCDLAGPIRDLGLGLVLADPDDAAGSARALRDYLAGPDVGERAGRARRWALTEATPAAVAERIAAAYEQIGRPARGRTRPAEDRTRPAEDRTGPAGDRAGTAGERAGAGGRGPA